MARSFLPPWQPPPGEPAPRPSLANVRPLRRPAGQYGAGGRRHSVDLPAELRFGRTRLSCTVLDISNFGASVRIRNVLPDVARTWLIIARLTPIQSLIVWRKRDRLGLRFASEQQWVPELVRDRFDPSAWLRRSWPPPDDLLP